MKRRRILFIDRGPASYVDRDLRLLKEGHEVERVSFMARSGLQLPVALVGQLISCIRGMSRARLVIVHFAGWGSFIPLLLARVSFRPSVLFLHGVDAVSLPELDYGNFRKWPLSMVTRASLKLASRIVVVDASLVRSVNSGASGVDTEQGIKHFVPELTTPVMVIPHGFDPTKWFPAEVPKDIDVITVGSGLTDERVRKLKGVDRLVDAARLCPELRFLVVGWDGSSDHGLPHNVEVMSLVPNDRLPAIYQRAKCYLQLSLSEGFGCALVEAMFCGCIPVVNQVGAMPGIVDIYGRVVDARSDQDVVSAIRWACDASIDRSSAVAKHAMVSYPLSRRRSSLLQLVDHLIGERDMPFP